MNPAVSVVIPLFNRGNYIKRAVNSVIAQSFKDFEILVIDDGSTDNGVDVVRQIVDPRIRLIQQKNMGVSAARNCGIGCSKGDLIAFLDADDEWLPSFLETILNLQKNFPDAGMFLLAYNENNPPTINDKKQYLTIPNHPWEGILQNYFKTVVLDQTLLCTSSTCIPKFIFFEMGMFKEGVQWGEDQDLWGRIAIKYPIVFSTHMGAIVHLVESKESKIRKRFTITKIHPFIEYAKKNVSEKLIPISILSDFKEYIAYLQILTTINHLELGNRKIARKLLENCETNRFKKDKTWYYFWSFIPYGIYKCKIIKRFRDSTISFLKHL